MSTTLNKISGENKKESKKRKSVMGNKKKEHQILTCTLLKKVGRIYATNLIEHKFQKDIIYSLKIY